MKFDTFSTSLKRDQGSLKIEPSQYYVRYSKVAVMEGNGWEGEEWGLANTHILYFAILVT